jgi:hypothetical protein
MQQRWFPHTQFGFLTSETMMQTKSSAHDAIVVIDELVVRLLDMCLGVDTGARENLSVRRNLSFIL